jgi:DNA-binding NarL/FixJ family response regulator
MAEALHLPERSIEKHSKGIFFKLGLAEELDIDRRVKAVLLHLGTGN